MRILITGATGLVGRALTTTLLEHKYQVSYLTTRADQLNAIAGAKGFLWNPAANTIDENCFEGVDAIIHLAGASISIPWTRKNRQIILESRVQSTQLLQNAYRNYGEGSCQKFIAASAIGIYPTDFNQLWKEDDQLGEANGFLAEVVAAWENAVGALAEDIPTTIRMRIGLVLSTQGGVLPTLMTPVQFGIGAAFGSGKQYQSWIHIQDVANAFLHAVQSLDSGVYNIVAPNPVSQNELIKQLGKVMKRPVFLPNIPSFFIRLVLGERSNLVTDSKRVSSARLEASGFQHKFPKLEEALTDLIKNK